jgi:hypothetical protein
LKGHQEIAASLRESQTPFTSTCLFSSFAWASVGFLFSTEEIIDFISKEIAREVLRFVGLYTTKWNGSAQF